MSDNLVLPGACLGPAGAQCAGDNVHVRSTLLHSAVLGTVAASRGSGNSAPAVAIAPVACAGPAVGAVVIAQVARLTGGQVECCVVCIDGRPASEGFKGVITRSNIHESKTIDSTVYEWFRPGDFVRARVISTSDSKQLMLSTAQRDLGVIRIPSAEEEMIPISWKFFLGTKTGTVVKRKVAHPSAAADGSSK